MRGGANNLAKNTDRAVGVSVNRELMMEAYKLDEPIGSSAHGGSGNGDGGGSSGRCDAPPECDHRHSQQQQRGMIGSSSPESNIRVLKNFSGNSSNKHSAASSYGISSVSDTSSETVSVGGSSEQSSSQGSAGIRRMESVDNFSRGGDSASGLNSGLGQSEHEHDESASLSLRSVTSAPSPRSSEGGLVFSHMKQCGISFPSLGGKVAADQSSTSSTRPSSLSGSDNRDCAHASMQDSVVKVFRKEPTRGRGSASKSGKSTSHPRDNVIFPSKQHHALLRPSKLSSKSKFLNVKECKTVEELIQLVRSHGKLSPLNLSAFWSRLAQLLRNERKKPSMPQELKQAAQHLKEILDVTMTEAGDFGSRELSGAALGVAKVVIHARTTRGSRAQGRHDVMFQEVFLGNSSQASRDIFESFASAADAIPRFDARDLCNLAYSFALVNYLPVFEDGETLIDQIARHASACLEIFNSQGLSNLVWSCAKLGAPQPRLFEEVADAIVKRDPEIFNPQDLSNIVWAYATMGESNKKLFQKIADAFILKEKAMFAPQHLSIIVWSYASVGELSREFSERAANVILSSDLKYFKHQALSNIVWAYATAALPCPHLFDKIADVIVARDLKSFDLQSLSNIVWAYATAGKSSVRMFVRISLLFTKVAASIAARDLGAFTLQDLSNTAWAFAVCNVPAPVLFNSRFISALCKRYNEFNAWGLSQLYQWHLWQLEINSSICLPPMMQRICREAFVSRRAFSPDLKDDVVRELIAVGLQPAVDVQMHSGYSLNALVELNGYFIGVEVDAPSNFICREPTAKTILKRRQVLNIDGVPTISVPHWEWVALGDNRTDKQQYLCSKLEIRNCALS